MRGSLVRAVLGSSLVLALVAPSASAQAQRGPDAWGRPELSFALGATGRPNCQGGLYNGYSAGMAGGPCFSAALLAEQGLGLGEYVTAGLREFGWLESGLVGWGTAAELRLNLPIGPVQLFAVGGAGPGSLRQSDAGLVRNTGVGLYLHGGFGARMLSEGRNSWVELKVEGQRWSGQDAIGTSGLVEHTNLSQPYFSLGFGFVPGSFSTN